MSKSLKNEYTLDDLEARGVSPADFRYYCLTLHYRTPMNFTWEGQAAAARAFARLRDAVSRSSAGMRAGPDAPDGFRRRFREAVEDDLNLPRAVGVVHEAARAGLGGETLRELGAEWDAVLGLGLLSGTAEKAPIPPEVVDLAARREAARRARDFPEADVLRMKIREAGYEVIDAKDGSARLRKL
jgi:cysteinyl-tRNA synthetase